MKRLIVTALLAAAALVAAPGAVQAAPTSLSVPDAVYGGTTTATVGGGGRAEYVYVQCYKPTFGGEYVFAAFYEIIDGSAELGPFATGSPHWNVSASADCTAQAGWFTARGFGVWKVAADTTFHVDG